MTVVFAVLIGMSAALLLGVIVGVSTRVWFARFPEAFRCGVRVPYGKVPGLGRRHLRGPSHARWAHDVLVIQHGLLPVRTAVLPVRTPEDSIRRADDRFGLGREPLVLVLELDDGQRVEVAVPGSARSRAVGPYAAAAIRGLPPATTERPPRGR